MVDKICETCGKEYQTRYKLQRFCCQSCAQAKKKRAFSICKYCEKEFSPKKTGAKFCSRECYNRSREQKTKNCKICWKEFIWCRNTQQYCSVECWEKDICLEVLEKKCLNCGKTFTTKEKDRKYCCHNCREHQNKKCEICWADFITNSYNQKVCSNCTEALKKKWRDEPRIHICKHCWQKFKWAYKNTTCKDCIKKLSSKQAHKMTEDYTHLPEDKKQEINKRRSEAVKNAIKNTSDRKREERQKKKSASLKLYYKDMTEEERKEYHSNLLKRAEERYEKTWYMWPVQQPEVLSSIKDISKEEKYREKILLAEWFNVETQFPLKWYRYDLKVWNTLIEVNPFPFHNSTRAPPKIKAKPKHPMYHYNKTKCAIDNWYNIINIWDWIDKDIVLSLLNKATLIKDAPTLHRYNPKSREHLIDEWYDVEDMLSKGFIEIRDWGEFYLVSKNENG